MTAIPEPMNSIATLIDQSHEENSSKPRPHMGASMLGHYCDRWLWLSFRWAVQPEFPGRVLRLFRRGHKEEDLIVADLRRIGVDVSCTGAAQAKVDFGCHVSGSIDGILFNLPFAPNTKAILECKTHSDKSFNDLLKNGLEKSKPQHWVQCHVYMMGRRLDRALYYAVNKNDDAIYTEWVHFDRDVAEKAVQRGKRLAMDERLPPPISTDASWYQCKFCDAHKFCHEKQPTKHANCRTCANVTPKDDGTFFCERWQDVIPVDHQHNGCDHHLIHPDLVPWEFEGSEDGLHVTWRIGDRLILNGPDGYKSREIVANPAACGDPMVEEVKAVFPGAEVVG
jgi:hypothetical protein